MPTGDRTFRIDPIEPGEIAPRLRLLVDRLAPVLGETDVSAIRRQVDDGDLAAAYARLDSITNDGTISVDTATLVEIVLLGQAIQTR
jgi:hypothetical protein